MDGARAHHQDSGDETQTRGRRQDAVSAAATKFSATYAPAQSAPTQIVAPTPNLQLPPPDLDSRSQTRTNQGPIRTLQALQLSEFAEKRRRFCRRFVNNNWNHPDEANQLDDELTKQRAVVVAIHYGRPDPLPATYVDACSIVDMLEGQFCYPPKCIRVLADLVDPDHNKDSRWPNKENIINSIKWLNEKSQEGSRRFLFFAGHGYTVPFKIGDCDFTSEGILPRDYLTIVPFEESEDPDPKAEIVDRKTVLLNCELNRCLVRGLADGVKLTVMFDCCHSGGLSVSTPKFEDMSHLRSRHLFARQPFQMADRDTTNELYVPPGNLLDLPVKVELENCDLIKSLARSDNEQILPDISGDPNQDFEAFPENCQVVSWCACEGTQLAHEDSQGGRFTRAFIKGIKQPGSSEISTYRLLNKYIWSEFDRYNQRVDETTSSETAGGTDPNEGPTAVRASVNKSPECAQQSKYQYPKLYVSASIAPDFADKIVDI